MACETGLTNILPSPMAPVRAALTITSTARCVSASLITSSILLLGSMSTRYSSPPRPAWTIPFWIPRPVTLTMLSPTKPAEARASLTTSSRSGRTIASILFTGTPALSGSDRTQPAGMHACRCKLSHSFGRHRDTCVTLLELIGALAVLTHVQTSKLVLFLDSKTHGHIQDFED